MQFYKVKNTVSNEKFLILKEDLDKLGKPKEKIECYEAISECISVENGWSYNEKGKCEKLTMRLFLGTHLKLISTKIISEKRRSKVK